MFVRQSPPLPPLDPSQSPLRTPNLSPLWTPSPRGSPDSPGGPSAAPPDPESPVGPPTPLWVRCPTGSPVPVGSPGFLCGTGVDRVRWGWELKRHRRSRRRTDPETFGFLSLWSSSDVPCRPARRLQSRGPRATVKTLPGPDPPTTPASRHGGPCVGSPRLVDENPETAGGRDHYLRLEGKDLTCPSSAVGGRVRLVRRGWRHKYGTERIVTCTHDDVKGHTLQI